MDDFENKTVQALRRSRSSPIFNKEAHDKLVAAEKEYLLANNWVQEAPELDEWDHDGFSREALTQGHAVNVQKQFDRLFAGGLHGIQINVMRRSP